MQEFRLRQFSSCSYFIWFQLSMADLDCRQLRSLQLFGFLILFRSKLFCSRNQSWQLGIKSQRPLSCFLCIPWDWMSLMKSGCILKQKRLCVGNYMQDVLPHSLQTKFATCFLYTLIIKTMVAAVW